MAWQPWDRSGYPYFDRPKPREVKGGIKAQSRRGGFTESWWGRRWTEALEGLNLGGRLARGRSYGRRGQVVAISIEKGLVRAVVQGSRPEPYHVTIKVRPFRPSEWRTVMRALSAQAVFAARMLTGEMPREIEDVFARAGLSLFPRAHRELGTACSCPDWSNPCKHVAAVYYLLGEQFDRDPFLLFRLRGLTRDELTGALAARPDEPPAADTPAERERPGSQDHTESRSRTDRAYRLEARGFWDARPLPREAVTPIDAPATGAALVRRLGPLPFWRGDTPLLDVMTAIYDRTSARAVERLTPGDRQEGSRDG
jgi:uncharacterized Zn finger protein